MTDAWHEAIPQLSDFAQVTDPAYYQPVPDDWWIGISDVVDSTAAVRSGKYKAVNLAGAGTISAVANELGGDLSLFIFGGDGARFVVPPENAERAAKALSRVATWARRDLDLELRVATMPVADVRVAGNDVRAAFWRASDDVRYAMFMGDGLEWAETQLKDGKIRLDASSENEEPDLNGLSCLWGPVQSKQGKIVSLIVRPVPGAPMHRFSEIASAVIALLEESQDLNPVPPDGPNVRWPSVSIDLQSRVAQDGRSRWLRRAKVVGTAGLIWLIFKIGIRLSGFDPKRYRREMAVNTDFRKFDDALMMTVDCTPEMVSRLRDMLEDAVAEGIVRYGLHMQDEAIMTCVAPSVQSSDHMHFIDGGEGGYVAAAAQLRRADSKTVKTPD